MINITEKIFKFMDPSAGIIRIRFYGFDLRLSFNKRKTTPDNCKISYILKSYISSLVEHIYNSLFIKIVNMLDIYNESL